MKSKQLMFFGLIEDYELILKKIETQIFVKYYLMGLLDNKKIPSYNSIFDVSNIGYTQSGDWNRVDTYLVLKKETKLNIEIIPQKNGGTKFAVDQLYNPESIELKLGGIHKDIKNVLVAGRIATVSEEITSLELYKIFTTNFRKKFKKIGAFYVGEFAKEKLKSCWRLVTDVNSPKEYDLAL